MLILVLRMDISVKNGYWCYHVTNYERDIGVIMDADLKFDRHVTDKVDKANRILGLVRQTFMHLYI